MVRKFGSAVSSGNTVILFAFQYNSGGTAMSSSGPEYNGSPASGASQVLAIQSAGSDTVYMTIWMLPDLPGGGTSVALTNSGGTVDGNVMMAAIEVSGLGASPLLDPGAVPNPATAQGTSAAESSGSTGNITSAAELIAGGCIAFGDFTGVPGGWTGLQSSSEFCSAGWQVPGSPGGSYVYDPGTTGAVSWSAGVAAIEAYSPAAGPAYSASMAAM